MTTQYVPNLGELAGEDARRDAVHIAVAPVIAGKQLFPGERVGPAEDGLFYPEVVVGDKNLIGIVDPFLKGYVLKGKRFWLFLYPNTVTSLRHVWTHPAFRAKSLETI